MGREEPRPQPALTQQSREAESWQPVADGPGKRPPLSHTGSPVPISKLERTSGSRDDDVTTRMRYVVPQSLLDEGGNRVATPLPHWSMRRLNGRFARFRARAEGLDFTAQVDVLVTERMRGAAPRRPAVREAHAQTATAKPRPQVWRMRSCAPPGENGACAARISFPERKCGGGGLCSCAEGAESTGSGDGLGGPHLPPAPTGSHRCPGDL